MERLREIFRGHLAGYNHNRYLRVVGILRGVPRTGPDDLYIFNSSVEVAARREGNHVFLEAFSETWWQIATSRYNNTQGNEQARVDAVDDNNWDDTVGTLMCMGWFAYLCGDEIRFAQDAAPAA